MDYVWHFASPASPVDYLELPIQTLKVGSLGTHKALGLAKEKGGPVPAGLDLRDLRRSAGASADARITGETSIRLARAAATTNPSDLPRPWPWPITGNIGIDTKIVRIFNTYGPRMRLHDGRVVPAFISQALENKPLTVFGKGTRRAAFVTARI